MELVESMFGGQFETARGIAASGLPPLYTYAVETCLQLTLTELNENLRDIYVEAYSLPNTAEYIYLHTTAELKQIFGSYFPDYSESDFPTRRSSDLAKAISMRWRLARPD